MHSIISYLHDKSMIYLIGQLFGILGIISVIIMPQFKKKSTINIVYFLCNLFSFLNVLCLAGMGSAAYVFFVVFVQIAFSIYHDCKSQKPKMVENIIFAIMYLVVGLIGFVSKYQLDGANMSAWDICLQLLPIVGAEFAMLLVATPNPQHARVYQICNSSLWGIYYGCIGSTLVICQIFAIVSSTIGIIRHREK